MSRELPPDEVHVWLGKCDLDRRDAAWLSPAECQRAGQFRFERDRARYVGRHLFLRAVLADYLGVRPAELTLVIDEYGKPRLGGSGDELRFSLSHSDGLCAVAIGRGGELGIDIERQRPIADAQAIVERYFAPEERAWFASLPAASRPDAFVGMWTRKEAVVKALGLGLEFPLDQFSVAQLPADGLIQLPHGSEPLRLQLRDLDLRRGFVAALACGANSPQTLRYFDDQ